MRKNLSKKEREGLQKLASGRMSPNSVDGKDLLSRPHVAIAFETILDNAGLSDEALVRKMHEIVSREAVESVNVKSGSVSTNQTAVDANALNAIRTIWQIKGKFIERKEVKHSGGIADMDDEQLDKIIESGGQFIKYHKSQISHNEGNNAGNSTGDFHRG